MVLRVARRDALTKTVNGAQTTYTYTNNPLVQATGNEAETFGFDTVGNQTLDHLGGYTYAQAEMLETATMVAGVVLTYRYDGDTLRTLTIGSIDGVPPST